MFVLCVSGAVNTQGFVWKVFFYARAIYTFVFIHYFIHSFINTNRALEILQQKPITYKYRKYCA